VTSGEWLVARKKRFNTEYAEGAESFVARPKIENERVSGTDGD
jgi:hypothetical protein